MSGGEHLPNDLWRTLGRIEQKQDEAKEGATHRDEKLQEIDDRVRENAHQANNTATILTGTIKTLQQTTSRSADAIDGIIVRVNALEEPLKAALAQRDRRRNLIARGFTIASTIFAALWFLGDPIYKAIVPILIKQWMGN